HVLFKSEARISKHINPGKPSRSEGQKAKGREERPFALYLMERILLYVNRTLYRLKAYILSGIYYCKGRVFTLWKVFWNGKTNIPSLVREKRIFNWRKLCLCTISERC